MNIGTEKNLAKIFGRTRFKANTVHLRRFRTFLVNGETQGPSDLPALARE